VLSLEIKKGEGVKMEGKGGELKTMPRAWHEIKANAVIIWQVLTLGCNSKHR